MLHCKVCNCSVDSIWELRTKNVPYHIRELRTKTVPRLFGVLERTNGSNCFLYALDLVEKSLQAVIIFLFYFLINMDFTVLVCCSSDCHCQSSVYVSAVACSIIPVVQGVHVKRAHTRDVHSARVWVWVHTHQNPWVCQWVWVIVLI